MPMHDWTRVDDGTFHDFHTAWIGELRKYLIGAACPRVITRSRNNRRAKSVRTCKPYIGRAKTRDSETEAVEPGGNCRCSRATGGGPDRHLRSKAYTARRRT